MVLPKFFSTSTLSLAGVALLVGGLGISIIASGQQQDNRSQASAQSSWPETFVAAKNATGPTLSGFVVGGKYKIEARGVADYNSDGPAMLVDPMWGADYEGGKYTCFCQRYAQPKLNGKGWTAEDVGTKYQSDHSYYDYWTADKTTLQFSVSDSNLSDNKDGWYIKVTLVSLPEDANKAPTANAGPDQTIILPTSNVTLMGTGTDSDGSIASYSWTKTSGPNGETIATANVGTTAVTGLVEGVYKFTLKVTDNKGATATDDVLITVSKPTTLPPTTFKLDLLFHGIGKGGDNQNPNGGGNQTPIHPTRSVVVDVYDLDGNPVIENKEGQVTFDSVSGTYKGEVVMGTTLQAQAYTIRVKLSHSLRASISRNIIAGQPNDIPVIKLVNGDTNNDARLDIEDYSIIQACYSDFDLPPADCDDPAKRLMADIDDDNKVNQFDLNLFLREMSVQEI